MRGYLLGGPLHGRIVHIQAAVAVRDQANRCSAGSPPARATFCMARPAQQSIYIDDDVSSDKAEIPVEVLDYDLAWDLCSNAESRDPNTGAYRYWYSRLQHEALRLLQK